MKRWIIALCFALFMPLCSLAEVWTEDQFTSDGQFSMRCMLFNQTVVDHSMQSP